MCVCVRERESACVSVCLCVFMQLCVRVCARPRPHTRVSLRADDLLEAAEQRVCANVCVCTCVRACACMFAGERANEQRRKGEKDRGEKEGK